MTCDFEASECKNRVISSPPTLPTASLDAVATAVGVGRHYEASGRSTGDAEGEIERRRGNVRAMTLR